MLERMLKTFRNPLFNVSRVLSLEPQMADGSEHSVHILLQGRPEFNLLDTKLTASKNTRAKTNDASIHYYDRDRISLCGTLIITIMVLALLVVPVWILYRLSIAGTIATSPDTLCVVAVFTLICTAMLSCFTKAKRHEIVAASAA